MYGPNYKSINHKGSIFIIHTMSRSEHPKILKLLSEGVEICLISKHLKSHILNNLHLKKYIKQHQKKHI